MRPLYASLLLGVAILSNAADPGVVLEGITYHLTSKGYEPLAKVQLVITRDNGVVTNGESDQDGKFHITLKAGTPFVVVFYGEKRVPELQQLAGIPAAHDFVQVTLLSPTQYTQLFGASLPLADKLDCALKAVPPEAKDARARIQELRSQIR